jgi:hypothetical protein
MELEDIKDRAAKKSRRKHCVKIEEMGDFSSVDPYKTEMKLEEDINN